MKNTIIKEMNLKLNYENVNEMIENLSNEMEVTKMKKLGLYESRTFGRISYGFVRDDKGMFILM